MHHLLTCFHHVHVSLLVTACLSVVYALQPIEGAYDPADYDVLDCSADIKDLFMYITQYKPQQVELETCLKPFIPEYIPAVGDIDTFTKVSVSLC